MRRVNDPSMVVEISIVEVYTWATEYHAEQSAEHHTTTAASPATVDIPFNAIGAIGAATAAASIIEPLAA